MSSTTDPHTPLPLKRSISDSFTPSSEAKKSSPSSLKEIDGLIAAHIETAKVSCPVELLEHFSHNYSLVDLDNIFNDHREVRLAITSEDTLIIKDMPTPPHEVANRFFQNEFCRYNIDLTGKPNRPMTSLGSTTTRYDDLWSRYEADSSFRNMHSPTRVDDRHRLIPSIIIEIGYSETINSLFRTANVYLGNPDIHIVISVKIVGSNDKAKELICFVHKRSPGGILLESAISFGLPMSEATRAAILPWLEGTPLIEVPNDYHSQIRQDLYSIIIPHEILWVGVDEAIQPADASDYRIYLYDMLELLHDAQCLGEGIATCR
jgi:hypothetical protein